MPRYNYGKMYDYLVLLSSPDNCVQYVCNQPSVFEDLFQKKLYVNIF